MSARIGIACGITIPYDKQNVRISSLPRYIRRFLFSLPHFVCARVWGVGGVITALERPEFMALLFLNIRTAKNLGLGAGEGTDQIEINKMKRREEGWRGHGEILVS